MVSFNQLELAGLPGLIKPRLQGTIQPQEDIPTLAWNGLYPVGLMSLRRGGAEPDMYRCVRVHDHVSFLAANAGELFVGLKHRSGLIVIDDERPEVLGWNIGRQVNPIGFAAIQWLAFGIDERSSVLRSNPDHLQGHGGGDACGVVMKHSPCIEIAHPGLEQKLVPASEGCNPGAVWVE